MAPLQFADVWPFALPKRPGGHGVGVADLRGQYAPTGQRPAVGLALVEPGTQKNLRTAQRTAQVEAKSTRASTHPAWQGPEHVSFLFGPGSAPNTPPGQRCCVADVEPFPHQKPMLHRPWHL